MEFYVIPFLVVLGFLVFWLAMRLLALQRERESLRSEIAAVEQQAREATQRLSVIFRLREQYLDADDEQEIIHAMLPHLVEMTSASGASFVPLDEHGQPMVAVSFGEMPASVPDAWVEYLASPAIRERCKVCETHNHLSTTCPLLKGPFTEAVGMFCVPLRTGDCEYGVLNLYIPDLNQPAPETQAFLQSMTDETAMALQSIRLRKRELNTLRQMQEVRQKADLNSLLSGLLENVCQALEADFSLLAIVDQAQPAGAQPAAQLRDDLIQGVLPLNARPFLSGVVQGVLASGEPVILGNVSGDAASPLELKAVLAAPLVFQGKLPMGALLAGNRRAQNFHQRHLSLIQTVAAQIALVIQNNHQQAQLEYKTMMDERARLAREIHDGLAQTLGFLKLQVAQMQNYLERGDLQRLKASLRIYYQNLSEAYGDARNAIDGLRISTMGKSIHTWLPQVVEEFQENVDGTLEVSLDCLETHSELPSEIQAQLIRIVQEALSNVRKHAGAEHVWISCSEDNGDLVLQVRDDGHGFSPEDVPGPSQHGLRGMRERIDLIGADFQVISLPQKGTTIRVSLPLKMREMIL